MPERFLTGKTIALSVSDSPDLLRLGMSPRALDHAVIEIARYLLRAGARLAYGGDLRENGFTRALFELVRRYRREDPEAPPLQNYLSWTDHMKYPDEFLQEKTKEYAGAARIIPLGPVGKPCGMRNRVMPGVACSAAEALMMMRAAVTEASDARVVLGGKVSGFSGQYPGIAEETALTLLQGKTLLLVGGFGGCTRDISATFGFGSPWTRDTADVGRRHSDQYRAGLEYVRMSVTTFGNVDLPRQNNRLADSRNLPEIIRLVLDGLRDHA